MMLIGDQTRNYCVWNRGCCFNRDNAILIFLRLEQILQLIYIYVVFIFMIRLFLYLSLYPLHPMLEIKVRILPIHDKYLDQNKDCNINAQNQITSIIFDCKNKSIT